MTIPDVGISVTFDDDFVGRELFLFFWRGIVGGGAVGLD